MRIKLEVNEQSKGFTAHATYELDSDDYDELQRTAGMTTKEVNDMVMKETKRLFDELHTYTATKSLKKAL